MRGDWEVPLDALRWHWGDAYLIHCLSPGRWVAQRRDSHATMSAEGPEELRERIAADYSAHPISTQGVGLGRPETPGCRFLPEG